MPVSPSRWCRATWPTNDGLLDQAASVSGGRLVGPPATIHARMPAKRAEVSRVRKVVAEAIQDVEGDDVDASPILMAVDVVAPIIIAHARPWSLLDLTVVHDDEDVYVRLSAPCRDAEGLAVDERSGTMLQGIVQSVDLTIDGGRAYAVIQQARHDVVVRSY